jgi:hypothetical protein
MTKTFTMFLAGLCAGAAATLVLCPTVREDAKGAIDNAKTEAWNQATTHKRALENSVHAAKATYKATVKSAGMETAPMEA